MTGTFAPIGVPSALAGRVRSPRSFTPSDIGIARSLTAAVLVYCAGRGFQVDAAAVGAAVLAAGAAWAGAAWGAGAAWAGALASAVAVSTPASAGTVISRTSARRAIGFLPWMPSRGETTGGGRGYRTCPGS